MGRGEKLVEAYKQQLGDTIGAPVEELGDPLVREPRVAASPPPPPPG